MKRRNNEGWKVSRTFTVEEQVAMVAAIAIDMMLIFYLILSTDDDDESHSKKRLSLIGKVKKY